jgi:pimeloyl-ACP methyl ester carboxylesterase
MSGLLAAPGTTPRALVLALHGGGMSAAYFHGTAHPDLSLLALGRRLGFSVLALDRPGYGRSRPALPQGQPMRDQAETVLAALDAFGAMHSTGGGVFVVAHSYGLKVALHLAAHPRGTELLGLDGSGAAYRFQPALEPSGRPREAGPDGEAPTWAGRSRRELFWGAESLYPPGTFAAGMRPVAPVPEAESLEAPRWPRLLPPLAARVRVPYQFTVAEHEPWWRVTDADLAEYRALFTAAACVTIRRQPAAGHNISLGWAARSYHLNALAFAEHCLLRTCQAAR